jgi:regulator of sirC expression with transglutaminase-like and TPR domain
MRGQFILPILCLLAPSIARGSDDPSKDTLAPTVEKLAADAKKSIVVMHYTGRDGRQVGLGTGFVVGKNGLVATSFHVIGEARPITVQLPDGSKHDVDAIHAADRGLDLAVVHIKVNDLVPLPLGDAQPVKPGQALVALGHPRGLKYSVVAGVLSGQREVEGIPMLQVAMPIEQGNSGGPVLDMRGRVVGIVTLKSLVTANLGFAVPVTPLQRLLDRPNPIPMEKWLTIGALDKSEWQTFLGGRWRQRAGRIIADGTGAGFGGRTLCYWMRDVPKTPYELAVTVKLDDEAGAAGLIFGGDGAHEHYGFYPSGGKLRLTRFAGPDVFSWKILQEIPSEHYRPGDWNTLKVRVEADRFTCYVNDKQVAEQTEPDYAGTRAGLAKFRQTVAEFKRFQCADRLASGAIDAKTMSRLQANLPELLKDKEPSVARLGPLLKSPEASANLLRDRARQLEQEAAGLRKLAQTVHEQRCLADLAAEADKADKDMDLARAALLLAKMDNEDLDVDAYVKELDRFAREIKVGLPKDTDAEKRLASLNRFLFREHGFHGSRLDYYSRNNSYLNEVIDDREGLPITLAVLYMELARRLDLQVVGVALPGHFIVRQELDQGRGRLIDVYEGGKEISDKDAEDKVRKTTGQPLDKKDLAAVGKKAILVRMLHNLMNVARHEDDRPAVLRYLDGIVTLSPDAHAERWARAVLRFQAGQRGGALADCDFLLENAPAEADLARVRELHKLLVRER